MGYALQLVQERKERLARMEAKAWRPPVLVQQEQPTIVPVVPEEPVAIHKPKAPGHGWPVDFDYAMALYIPGFDKITIRDIVSLVAEHFDLSITDMLSMRRTPQIVRPRQVAMYLAVDLTGRSLPEIGRYIGGKDHTTVLHAARKIPLEMARDPLFGATVGTLRARMQAMYGTLPRSMAYREPKSSWTPEMVAYLTEHWGNTTKIALAQHLGVSPSAAYRKAARLGLSRRPIGRPRSERPDIERGQHESASA